MLRVFLALNILLLSLFACKGGYKSCKLKINNLNVIQNQNISIPLKNNQTLIYSRSPVNAKIIKHDPFLNLYLVESKKHTQFPFRMNNKLSLGMASVDKQMATEGALKLEQVGLNSLGTFSEAIFAPSLLLSSCCNIEGLVTPSGIIQKEYVDHFINSKNRYYGDIGIRVIDDSNLIIIKYVDPFEKAMKFKKGDCITHINGKKVDSASYLMKEILFSKLDISLKVNIIRDGEKIVIDTKVKQRFGGGVLSDTFLEQSGLYLNDDLTISIVGKKYKNYGLHVGDKLLQVNGEQVNTIEDIRNNIDNFKHFPTLLLSRNHFQFFVNIR